MNYRRIRITVLMLILVCCSVPVKAYAATGTQKGFLVRLWERIVSRFRGADTGFHSRGDKGKEEEDRVREEKAVDKPAGKEVDSRAMLSRSELIVRIEDILERSPGVMGRIPNLSKGKSHMDGRVDYYWQDPGQIPLKLDSLEKEQIYGILLTVEREARRTPPPVEGGTPVEGSGSGPAVPRGADAYAGDEPGSEEGPDRGGGGGLSSAGETPAAQTGMTGGQAPVSGERDAVEPLPSGDEGPGDKKGKGGAEEEPEPEEKEEEEIPYTKQEMIDIIKRRVKVFEQIAYMIPNFYFEDGLSGDREYYYIPEDGITTRIEDLDKSTLHSLFVRVNNEATRLNTERIMRQIQQQEQVMRNMRLQQQQVQQMQQPPQPPRVHTPPQQPPQAPQQPVLPPQVQNRR